MPQFSFLSNRIHLESVDSTNNYAAKLIREQHPPEGTVILADFQESGRGQRDHVWIGEKGKNLTFSIILYPDFLRADRQFYISMAVAVGISSYLQTLLSDVRIKWSNDIYVGKKKIAGILIENALLGNFLKSTVIGIGLNVNQKDFPDFNPPPTSLFLEFHREHNKLKVFEDMVPFLSHELTRLYEGRFAEIKNAYESQLLWKGQTIAFMKDDHVLKGTLEGVNNLGQLRIRMDDDSENWYNFNEIVLQKPF